MQAHLQLLKDQGPVWDMAGLRNFDGSGWRHTWLLRWLGLDLSGSTFVAKTTTTDPRPGNTPLRPDFKTVHIRPPSVYLRFWGSHTLNSWGLSGPGAAVVLERLACLAERGVFKALQISFMPVGDDPMDQLRQTREFVALLKGRLRRFSGVALVIQFNASCPNTGHDLKKFVDSLGSHLDILGRLGIPVVIKESVDTDFSTMRRVVEHPLCAGLVTTNCVKFGNLPDKIPWQKIFGTESPLKHLGGGGYSGPYLLPLVIERVAQYRLSGYHGFVAAGGGIQTSNDVGLLFDMGADAICPGATLVNYRPWNSRAVIREAWKRHLQRSAARS